MLVFFYDWYTYLLPHQLNAIESSKTQNFPAVSNSRSTVNRHINVHYYDKTPTLYGYNPIAMPAVFRLQHQTVYIKLFSRLLYAVDAKDMPRLDLDEDVDNLTLTTDALSARITLSTDQKIVWSSAYTPSWRGTLDGKPIITRKNSFGLTSFDVPAGTHEINFFYRPWYLWISLELMAFGIIISMLTLIIPFLTYIHIAMFTSWSKK